ncbi:MAG: DNA polymerase III subunit beta [Actinobacteria bacterium]|nr:DNA polymerase III subunit beta [Actinomycetota bacterium]
MSCAKDVLSGALTAVGRATSSKTTVPVLGNVLLEALDGRVQLSATDMEISLRAPLDATIEEPGAVVLPRLAADIVRSMGNTTVTIEHRSGEGVVTVTGGTSSFTLNCHQASEFPELPPDVGEGITLPAAPVVESADRVGKAASRDDTRPVLTGVLVRIEHDALTMVATDSYRLAVRQDTIEGGPAEPLQALVPARALAEVQRIVNLAGTDTVEIVLTDTQGIIRAGDVRLTTRLIDGQFPDYRQLIPESFEHNLVLDRQELQAVVSRIAVLAQRNTPVRMRFEDGQLTVSATSEQLGEGTESVPVAFNDEPIEIGFNVEFLRAGIESIEGDELRLGIISPLRPGLLRGTDDRFRYLLMPIRLSG